VEDGEHQSDQVGKQPVEETLKGKGPGGAGGVRVCVRGGAERSGAERGKGFFLKGQGACACDVCVCVCVGRGGAVGGGSVVWGTSRVWARSVCGRPIPQH
jgi:hypothetical protein